MVKLVALAFLMVLLCLWLGDSGDIVNPGIPEMDAAPYMPPPAVAPVLPLDQVFSGTRKPLLPPGKIPPSGSDKPGIEGRVVELETGRPIMGAKVEFYDLYDDSLSLELVSEKHYIQPRYAVLKTDEEGVFRLLGRHQADWYTVLVTAPGRAVAVVGALHYSDIIPARSSPPLRICMAKSREAMGMVVDKVTGLGVPGLEVHLSGASDIPGEEADHGDLIGVDYLSVLTDDLGRFRISGIDPRLHWTLGSSGGSQELPMVAGTWVYSPHITANRYHETKPQAVDLKALTTLSLSVQPFPRFDLELQLPPGLQHRELQWLQIVAPWVKRNATGGESLAITGRNYFDVPYPPSGQLNLGLRYGFGFKLFLLATTCDRPFLFGCSGVVEKTDARKPVQVKMNQLFQQQVLVVDELGHPLAGVNIKWDSKFVQLSRYELGDHFTDKDGRFTCRGLPGAPLKVRFTFTGYQGIVVTVALIDPERHKLDPEPVRVTLLRKTKPNGHPVSSPGRR